MSKNIFNRVPLVPCSDKNSLLKRTLHFLLILGIIVNQESTDKKKSGLIDNWYVYN